MSKTTATISATFIGTGRLINADKAYGDIAAWANLSSKKEIEQSEIFNLIHAKLKKTNLISENSLAVFRGRKPPFEGLEPLAMEMGPPPHNFSAGGRYSINGHSVLYTASSVDGVHRETVSGAEGTVWVQEYNLPTKDLRVADFRNITQESDHDLNCLLWNAELAGVEGYPSLLFSQTFASWISKEFDGIALPGVRGDTSVKYFNVVIFSPENNWPNWLSGKAPYQI